MADGYILTMPQNILIVREYYSFHPFLIFLVTSDMSKSGEYYLFYATRQF